MSLGIGRASDARGQLSAADRLASALPEDFEEVFATVLTGDFGAVARLHQALETAAEWCRANGVGGGAELDDLADRVSDLCDELHFLGEGLGREIRSLRPVVATRSSPAVSARGVPAGPQTGTPPPPASGRSLPPTAARALTPPPHQGIIMTNSPSSASADNQPPTAADPPAWRRHLSALAEAAAGINKAVDDWDAVSDSFCDADGWPVDVQGYEDGKVKRDAEAWKHVEVFLAHGPEVLAGIRATARSTDYAEGPLVDGLWRVRDVGIALDRVAEIHAEWDDVMGLMEDSTPGSLERYEDRAKELRNTEGWPYAHELALHGPAFVRAAEHLAARADAEQPAQSARVRAALTRTATGTQSLPPASPPSPPEAGPPTPGRTR